MAFLIWYRHIWQSKGQHKPGEVSHRPWFHASMIYPIVFLPKEIMWYDASLPNTPNSTFIPRNMALDPHLLWFIVVYDFTGSHIVHSRHAFNHGHCVQCPWFNSWRPGNAYMRQAITRTLTGISIVNFQWHLNQNTVVFVQKMNLKMSSTKRRPLHVFRP